MSDRGVALPWTYSESSARLSPGLRIFRASLARVTDRSVWLQQEGSKYTSHLSGDEPGWTLCGDFKTRDLQGQQTAWDDALWQCEKCKAKVDSKLE